MMGSFSSMPPSNINVSSPSTPLRMKWDLAYSVVHELQSRLQAGSVPIFSTDGLKHYYYALTAHFGEWIVREGEKKAVWLVVSEFLYA